MICITNTRQMSVCDKMLSICIYICVCVCAYIHRHIHTHRCGGKKGTFQNLSSLRDEIMELFLILEDFPLKVHYT